MATLDLATSRSVPRPRLLRFSAWDAALVSLAALHGILLVAWPVAPVIAIGLWWNSNTIAHNFIHRPFFESCRLNLLFSAYLSVLLGIPQALWRDRHLAHHTGVRWRLRVHRQLVIETLLVLALFAALAVVNPRFALTTYLPGYLAGLALCALQGYYEHARGVTSHYGRLYNFVAFNDGYHAEHHANPAIHWTRLRSRRQLDARSSAWPPLLRWVDGLIERCLTALETTVLRSRVLQSFVLATHRRALRRLLPDLPPVRRAAIVGGGLFPRSALILRELLPDAELTIIDSSAPNLAIARRLAPPDVEFMNQRYAAGLNGFDLIIIPLSFDGDRDAVYRTPCARAVLVHDWIWHRRGIGAVISPLLLKRVNLVLA